MRPAREPPGRARAAGGLQQVLDQLGIWAQYWIELRKEDSRMPRNSRRRDRAGHLPERPPVPMAGPGVIARDRDRRLAERVRQSRAGAAGRAAWCGQSSAA